MKSILDYIKVFKNIETYKGPVPRTGFKDGNGVYDEKDLLGKRVRELMDEGYDFGEAVKQAMKEGYAEGGRIGFRYGSSSFDAHTKREAAFKAYKDYKKSYYNSRQRNPIITFREFLPIYAKENFAEGGRIGYEDGQLVRNTVDGSRPGYQGKKFIDEDTFIDEYENFQKLKNNLGTDNEFAKYLNKNYKTERADRKGHSGKFTTKVVQVNRKRYEIKTPLSNLPPSVQKQFTEVTKYLEEIIPKLNASEKYVTKEQVSSMVEKKFNIKPKYKMVAGEKYKVNKFDPDKYPIMNNLDSVETKIENTLKNMLIEDKPLKNFWHLALQERTGLDQRTIWGRINDSPTYKVIKDQGAVSLKNRFNKLESHSFLKELSFSDQLTQALEMEKGMPRFTGMGKEKYYTHSPKFKAMDFAKRNFHQNQGNGAVKFYNKNGKPITWNYGTELPYKEVYFTYNGKKYSASDKIKNTNNLTNIEILKKDFPEVYKNQTAINNLRRQRVDNPFGKGKITLGELVKKIQVDTYQWGKGGSTFDILHGSKGVGGEPFTNLSFNTRDVNQIEMGIVRDKTLSKIQKNNLVKSLYSLTGSGDPKKIEQRIIDLTGDIKSGKITDYPSMRANTFKAHLQNSRNKTAAEAQAKLFKKLGINIDDMCSNLVAGGGRIGFANKVCGTALVKRNPDQFLILSEQKMNKPFEFKGKKYNSFNEFAKTKPGLWKNLIRSAAKFGRYAASPTTLLGGEIWYTVLDTMASMDKGIKFNEALDNAFFLYNFDEGKKNMLAKGEELGWSDAQIQDATQVFDLAKNQMNIEKTEQKINTLGQWKEDKGFRHGEGIASGHMPLRYTDIEGDIERTKIYLSSIQKKQDDAWSNYQSGKTKAEFDEGFGLPYKLAEELRKEELIKAREEDKRKVRPLMSDIWNIFPSIWSPIDTIKEKYKLQGVSGFLPGGDKELLAKARAEGDSSWMFGMSDADLAEYNKERGFRTVEELKEGPLTSKEMEDILGRNKWLSFLYQPQASGGRAGYMGGGIAGIRKPSAIAPTGGPQSQGLASTPEYDTYNKEYKWQT